MRDSSEKYFKDSGSNFNSDYQKHYKKPNEAPFLRSELSTTTLLFGGLTWKHEILLKASFENLGYNCETLPNPDFEALQLGKEFCDPGLCNPVYFTFGALLKCLRGFESEGFTKKQIISKYVFFTAGSCGPCRFGMYESQFRLGLINAGFEGFRVIVFQQNEGLDQSKNESALRFDPDFFLRILSSFVLADQINDLVYQYRPYEKIKGSVDKLLEEVMAKAYSSIKKIEYPLIIKAASKMVVKGLLPSGFLLLLKIVFFTFCKEYRGIALLFIEKLKEIEYDFTRVKPIVKITGEFWAQTTEGDGNLNMHRFLEDNGAQVIPEPLSNWIMYILHQLRLNTVLRIRQNKHVFSFKKIQILSLIRNYKNLLLFSGAEVMFSKYFDRFRKIFLCIPYKLISQDKIREESSNYFNPLIEGGEGHLEIGKTLYYTKTKQCHMVISLKPFGCMPSSMSDGIMSAATSHNPDVLFSSIETGGEGMVNMYSRAMMTLNEAKESAKNEYLVTMQSMNLKMDDLNKNKNSGFFIFSKKHKSKTAISIAARFLIFKDARK